MRRILLALAGALTLLSPFAAFGTDATATVSLTQTGAGTNWVRAVATVTTTTTCSAGTGVIIPVNGAGSTSIDLRGTFTSTHKVKTSGDQGTTWSSDVTIYPLGGGTGVASLTAPGTWIVPAESLAAQQLLCLYTSAWTSSPTITMEASPTVVPSSLLANSGAIAVTQKGTTTATAPTGGNLTAATATSVFSSTAGVCSVTVSNLSTTIAMTCGQTNAVSLTVGNYVPALGSYNFGLNYGGNGFCFPASGTPAFSTQSTVCP